MQTPKSIRHIALDLLSRREHSPAELSKKLRLRNFSITEIEPLLTTLEKENLLNPTRFIENYIYHRRKKGIGPLRILAELQERGIKEELIEPVLNITDNTWFAEALSAWQKRFKNRLPADYKTRAQHMRFLHYRGFTPEQIDSVFESNK